MDLHGGQMTHGQQPDMHGLHQPHQSIDLLHVQHEMPLQQQQQELQPVQHLLQHPEQPVHQQVGVIPVDHSQAVRAKLEDLAYQLHNLNNTEQFQRRIHLAANWRLSDKNQEAFIYITAEPHQQEMPHPGHLILVPTFHLVAVGQVENNEPDVVLRLVAYNGTVVSHLDEKFSQLQNDLNNSKLLNDFAEKRFTMCYGLAKLPKRTQVVLLKRSNFLRERIDEKIVWRSLKCQYAIEKSVDGIILNCCDECRTILDVFPSSDGIMGNNIKKEPLDANDGDEYDDIYEQLFGDKPRLNVKERLDKLKLRGITINQPGEAKKKPARKVSSEANEDFVADDDEVEPLDDVPDADEDDSDERLPHMMVTVTMREGEETKVVPLEKIREMRIAERRRKSAPLIVQEKRKLKPVKRKSLVVRENMTPEEKKIKKEQMKAQEEAAERISSHIKKCPICQEPFADVNLFMSHLSKCNVSSEEEDDDEDNKDDGEEMEMDENGEPRKKGPASGKKKKKKKKRSFPLTALSCGICGQTFKFETHYEPHVKAHEEKLALDVEVVCPLCNETLATKRHLNPHFKKNHPNDGGCCVECLQVMDVGLLKQHLAKQHQQTGAATSHKEVVKGEGHLCPDCGKKCQYLSELEIHMAIQHMGIALERPSAKEEEVMCHECGKVFNHRYRLKQHLSTTHNKSRDHPCPFCAKVFCLKHQLTKHLLTHSDVKPFKCKYCDYQNVRKYRVQKHCQKAHNVAGTDQDIDIMEGGAKPSEFVQNFLNISTGKSHAAKAEPANDMGDNLQDRMMY